METKEYILEISANPETVWNTMIDSDKYRKWVKAFSEKSMFIGKWGEGEELLFYDPDIRGSKAILEIFDPYKQIFAKHIATIDKEIVEDTSSKISQKWIGTLENYVFKTSSNGTTLKIEMSTHPDFMPMFDKCWPKALKIIKSLCENPNF
jgi:hypothetical protein